MENVVIHNSDSGSLEVPGYPAAVTRGICKWHGIILHLSLHWWLSVPGYVAELHRGLLTEL